MLATCLQRPFSAYPVTSRICNSLPVYMLLLEQYDAATTHKHKNHIVSRNNVGQHTMVLAETRSTHAVANI